jgi:FAD synthetase
MTRVMAQGVFDILHPGHLHYLKESKKLGDTLVVVIARDSRVVGRKELAFNEDDRQEMVDALELVDEAVLGSEEDIYDTVKRVAPDVITLGYDQAHDEEKVKEMAETVLDHKVEVVRISEREGYSSSSIRD